MSLRLLLALVFILASAASLGWYKYQGNISDIVADFEAGVDLLPLSREVVTPPPLRGPATGQQTTLTTDGVFLFTNQHRLSDGKRTLTRNAALDVAAKNKVEDMFARQYFEHNSPTGEGPADLVDGVGYSYLRVGENLALGNFASDEALVQAWMDSPGHRANILAAGFTEIGIAVGQGVFEGNRTWLAVQTFATPSSVCPYPDAATKTLLDTERARLDQLDRQLKADAAYLDTRRQEIQQLFAEAARKIEEGNAEIKQGNEIYKETGDRDAAQPHWDRGEQLQEEGRQLQAQAEAQTTVYEAEQAEYNNLVDQLRAGSATLSKIIDQYNGQIKAANACAESYSE